MSETIQSYWNPAHSIPTIIQAGAGYRSDKRPRKPPSTAVLARSALPSGTAGPTGHASKSRTPAPKSLPTTTGARSQAPPGENTSPSRAPLPSRSTAGPKPSVSQRLPVPRTPATNAGVISTTKRPVVPREAGPQATSTIQNSHPARVPNAMPLASPIRTTVRSGRVVKKQNPLRRGVVRHAIAAA